MKQKITIVNLFNSCANMEYIAGHTAIWDNENLKKFIETLKAGEFEEDMVVSDDGTLDLNLLKELNELDESKFEVVFVSANVKNEKEAKKIGALLGRPNAKTFPWSAERQNLYTNESVNSIDFLPNFSFATDFLMNEAVDVDKFLISMYGNLEHREGGRDFDQVKREMVNLLEQAVLGLENDVTFRSFMEAKSLIQYVSFTGMSDYYGDEEYSEYPYTEYIAILDIAHAFEKLCFLVE